VTTVVAFLANLLSELSPLREFGILCSFGIASAFIIMVTFVPSCRQILDRRKDGAVSQAMGEKRRFPWTTAALAAGATAASRWPKVVVLVSLAITAGAIYAASNLETRFEMEDFLPPELEYTQDLMYIMDSFNFTTGGASILVKGNLSSPDVLNAIDATVLEMEDDELVAAVATPDGDRPDVSSILTLMQDVADDRRVADPLDMYDEGFSQLFAESLLDQDQVPDRNVKGLLDWIFESNLTGSRARGVLHRDAAGGYDSTVMRVGVTSDLREDAARLYDELVDDIAPLSGMVSSGDLERAAVTGMSIIIWEVTDSLQSSMSLSFVLTLLSSFVILTIVFWATERSIVLGAITMIPVLLCSAWILGSMYLLSIPYTMLTVMVTALTIGLGVTYGIHLTHRFVEELEKTQSIDESCRETVVNTGAALFGAAGTTVAGFGLLIFSLLPPLREFGGIVGLTITYAFLATVYVLPTFLVIWARRVRVKS
jgi:predicted RND superfamily exporter protein